LNCPSHPERKNYRFLPVSTSYEQELARTAEEILAKCLKRGKEVGGGS
jgi:hypothetical protein